MRPTTVAMALALGIGLPCTVVQFNGFSEWPTVWLLAGIGFAIGIIIMVTIDEVFYRKDQSSFIRQRNALTDATMIATLEREARLRPVERPTPEMDYDDAKASEIETFFRAGENAAGFSIRRLKDVVGSTTWTRLVHFYSSEPGWHVLYDYGGDDGYRLAEKWTVEMVLTELGAGHFPLPPFAVRDIRPYVRDTTRHNAAKQAEAVG